MASLNKVLLIGNLGKDPEVRHMPNGNPVCNFSVAVTETWKDKEGQKQERTEWVNIVIFGKLAEIAGQYLKKGSSVYLEGKLQTRKYQDKQTGADRYTTEVICDQMQMLGKRDESAPSGGKPQEYKPAAAKPQSDASSGFGDDFNDDMDF